MSRNYKFHNSTVGSNYLLPQSHTRVLVRQQEGATQFLTTGEIKLKRMVNLKTEEVIPF